MKRRFTVIALPACLLLVGLSTYVWKASGQTTKTTDAAANSREQATLAVNIVRVINTAEVVDCRVKGGEIDPNAKFLPRDQLRTAPCFRRAHDHFWGVSGVSLSTGSEIAPGLELRLVVSPQGDHYNLWLGQSEVRCGFAFYSDERGVIFEGKAIGCDAQGALGKP